MSILRAAQRLLGRAAVDELTLSELVTLVADDPSDVNVRAFHRVLMTSNVGARAPTAPRQRGAYLVTESDQIGIPCVMGEDGSRVLVVYCDIPALSTAHPDETFFEIESRVVLEMARAIESGVVVQNGTDGRDSWAGVPREHVADVLAGRHPSAAVSALPLHTRIPG